MSAAETTPLLDSLREVEAAIAQVHAAFGAPGDYGYDTKEGEALFRLYKAAAKLREAGQSMEKIP